MFCVNITLQQFVSFYPSTKVANDEINKMYLFNYKARNLTREKKLFYKEYVNICCYNKHKLLLLLYVFVLKERVYVIVRVDNFNESSSTEV